MRYLNGQKRGVVSEKWGKGSERSNAPMPKYSAVLCQLPPTAAAAIASSWSCPFVHSIRNYDNYKLGKGRTDSAQRKAKIKGKLLEHRNEQLFGFSRRELPQINSKQPLLRQIRKGEHQRNAQGTIHSQCRLQCDKIAPRALARPKRT